MRLVAAAFLALIAVGSSVGASRPESGMIEVEPGVSLFYERVGSGSSVVVVPGRFLYGPDVQRLIRPDRTLILYDMRNRGRSSRVERDDQIGIDEDVRDLEAVRRHFAASRVSLVGYSYLGLMTALYTLDHPERVERLVQIGPVPIRFGTEYPPDLVWRDPEPVVPPQAAQELASLRQQGVDRSSPREFCLRSESLSRLRLVGDPANAERIDIERRCSMENEWPVNLGRHLDIHFRGSVQNLDVPLAALRGLAVPVLTIHGLMDRNAPFAGGAEWAMTLPDARLIPVPRAAHQVWLDDPETFGDVDAFLAGNWPERAAQVRSWDDVHLLVDQLR